MGSLAAAAAAVAFQELTHASGRVIHRWLYADADPRSGGRRGASSTQRLLSRWLRAVLFYEHFKYAPFVVALSLLCLHHLNLSRIVTKRKRIELSTYKFV